MIKRLFDIFFSFIGLILLIPFFVLVGLWIKIDTKGPIFFRQERIGLNGKKFNIHKLRTMNVLSENNDKLTVANDSRITKSGKFLRKYKIDELPQLIDVFFGKMSFVGPRPEVEEFINLYPISIKNTVLSVRPGITDIASIKMLNESDILGEYKDTRKAYIEIILPIKQRYYLDYIKNKNLWHDIKIIFLTFKKIFLN